jgi:hypothetical protein
VQIAFLVDDLRSTGVTTYADLAATFNSQGIRPARGKWTARDLYLIMRRHRRAHPAAKLNAGSNLYARRAKTIQRLIGGLKRRGFKTHAVIAGALNARGFTTPRHGRRWTAQNVYRVLAAARRARIGQLRRDKRAL